MRRRKGILIFVTGYELTEEGVQPEIIEKAKKETEELYNGFEGIVVTMIPVDSSIYMEDSIVCEEMYFSKKSERIQARILGEELPTSFVNTNSLDDFLNQVREYTKKYTYPFDPEIAIGSEIENFILGDK